jgi:DNA helicase II / ATP-dependent DNA helicase PcrA
MMGVMDEEMDNLNPEQRQAVEHGEGPMLVIAGAGTGKTQVITRRIAHLIKTNKAMPGQVLALTFTEKAASEMEQRMVDLLGYLHNVDIITFNSFGDALVKRFSRDIGLSSELKLLSEIQRNIVIADNLDSFELEYFAPVSRPDKYISDMLSYFSKLKNELVKLEEYQTQADALVKEACNDAEAMEAKKQLELARAYTRYTDLCRERNFIDYDDQITLAIEILERRPNIASKLHEEIRYILVDEFQDTNRAQNRLLELLTGPNCNLMVVGDDDQSIYRFRGAAISNILAFKQQYPQAKQVVLTANYRSSQQILNASYRLIQNNNPERLEFKNQIDKRMVAQFEAEEPVIHTEADYDTEINWIVNDIKDRIKTGLAAKSVAILVRKNSQGLLLAKACDRVGLPYRLIGQSQDLYSQPEVQYLLYFFRFIANPNDSGSLYHLLAGEVFGFDVGKLRQAVDVAKMRHLSLEQVMRDGLFDIEQGKITDLITKIDHWRILLPTKTVGEVGFDFLENTGYVKGLVQGSDHDQPEFILKLNHLNQFFKTLHEFEKISEDKSVVGYVDHLGGIMKAGETTDVADVDVMADEIQIMTVHRAKGLEFEAVYIFDLTRGNFPSRERGGGIEPPPGLIPQGDIDDDWSRREERRLMYVAMTRAKRYLAMTFSIDHGGKLPHKPSEFLAELTGGEVIAPERGRQGGLLRQLEMFKTLPNRYELTPDFWQGDWLVLGVRQIDDYLKCPAEFRWRHILKVPERPSANLAYGNLLHKLVERFHRAQLSGKGLDVVDLMAMIEGEWPEEGFFSAGLEARSLHQAKVAIASFVERQKLNPRLPKSVEDSFVAKVEDARLIMKGRYDAVFESSEEGIEICDYKTGGAGIDNQDAAVRRAKTSDQLTMYALAWYLMHGEAPKKLTLDFLDQGFVGTVSKTAKQLETMAQKIVKVSNEIRSGNFEAGSSCFNCSHTNLYQ